MTSLMKIELTVKNEQPVQVTSSVSSSLTNVIDDSLWTEKEVVITGKTNTTTIKP